MKEGWCFLLELADLKLDKVCNERGYILIESLIGMILLSIVSFSLITVLPILAEIDARLDKQQFIHSKLFELQDGILFHGREFEGNLTIYSPFHFQVFHRDQELCATYIWRDNLEETICL